MFSSLAWRAGIQKDLLRCLAQRQVTTTAVHAQPFKEGPERDLVNFPRPKLADYSPKVRFGFIPDTWFTYFYPKTGVTGPYVLGAAAITTLFSKELLLWDDEFNNGVVLVCIILIANHKWGNTVRETTKKWVDDENQRIQNYEDALKSEFKEGIAECEKLKASVVANEIVLQAKRENILLQLEATYRARLMKAYSAVKKRLDYHVEIQNVQRRTAHKNLVDYVLRNVRASITPQQENDILKKCILDLNTLAAKA